MKLAGIGDMLTAFPAMEAIRAKYPISEITALVTPQSAPVLDGAGLVDRVIEFDKYAFDGPGGLPQLAASTELLRLAARLRTRSYDAVLLLHHLVTWPGIVKYAALTLGSGARVRAGLDDGRGRFLTLRAKDRGFGAKHEVEYWLEVAGLIGARTLDPAVRLRWGEAEDQFADRAWSAMGLLGADRVVAIHPGTGSYSPARRWPAERFSAVANALSEEGLVPMVVAGPGEEDLADLVCRGIRGRHTTLRGTPTPRHLAAVLARCDLFIGNDSGVTHVARAVGVPTVAIFGPSNHRAWAPYSLDRDLTRVVRVELPCSPCLYRGQSLGLRNGCGDPQCLIRVSPADVLAAAHEVLRGRA